MSACLDAEQAKHKKELAAANHELSEAKRHAANEAHRAKERLTAVQRKLHEAQQESSGLSAELQVCCCHRTSCTCIYLATCAPD